MDHDDEHRDRAGSRSGFADSGPSGPSGPSGLDPTAWTMRRHEAAPLRMTFGADPREPAADWQVRLRSKLVELLGGFPPQRAAIEPAVLEVSDHPTYRRTRLVFETRPGLAVAGYLLVPKNAQAPVPTVVCVPGHGRGVDDIVGIDQDPGSPGYQGNFALQAVEHGLAAFAIEPLGFGRRRDRQAREAGPDADACRPLAGAALLLGETMIGWRVWDVMRAIDFVETRPELDAGRVGCVGVSGGGTATLFAAALDPRIRCAYVSGYLNTFRASIMSLPHCIDNYIPGILEWAEMYDVAGLIAPRALYSEAGDADPIFPVAASRESFERVRRVYAALDAQEKVRQDVFEGAHVFHGGGWPFLVGALG